MCRPPPLALPLPLLLPLLLLIAATLLAGLCAQATRNIYGDGVKFFKGVYVHSVRRDDRQGLHRDFDATGQGGKDFRNSCDSWCNIGIYLTDQTPDQGPLWVVPGSNTLPRDLGEIGRAGEGFDAHFAPQARRICCRAGDAVIFDCLTIHAGGKHTERDRPGCFHSYRAAATGPKGQVEEWDAELTAKPQMAGLLGGLNDAAGGGGGAHKL